MSILRTHTELLLAEMKTDGHAPLKFQCADGNLYFCKHMKTMTKEEINCLAYEIVAHKLLIVLGIPTPEIALVKISKDTLNKDLIIKNKRLKEGDICFGSQEVKFAHELDFSQIVKNKTEFRRIQNPEDIIRIAMFDLWIQNQDRGRNFGEGFNYNLLIDPKGQTYKIMAFDHAFIFQGINNIGIFNPNLSNYNRNFLYQTPYYKGVVNHIKRDEFMAVINNFVPLMSRNYKDVVDNTIEILKPIWNLSPGLDKKIIALISNSNHINAVTQHIIQSKK